MIKSVQYNAALAITGAIRGTSKEKLYQELGFESLKDRRWMRRLCYLYEIVSIKQPAYLYDLIPPFQRSLRNKSCSHLSEHKFRHNFADSLNPLCSCSLETESTLHYFTQSPYD